MTDSITGSPMRISTDARAGGYLMLASDQVDAVKQVLDQAHIHYWLDRVAVSLDGGPAYSVINFGKNADVGQIQEFLNRASNR